ncbi:putative glycoside hydrolase, partial [Ralstonia sp. VS2407]
ITVVDATNGRALAGAIGHAPGANRTADREGSFSLEIDAAGTRLSVRAPGYARIEVTLAPAAAAYTIRMTPVRPKAVYLSAYGVADRTLRDAALSLQDQTAINALVIDVKGDSGVTPYRSKAREISGAASHVAGAIVHQPDLPDLLRT